jgi:hypothetical protein
MTFTIGWIVLAILSLAVITTWLAMGAKFAEDKVTPKQRVQAKKAPAKKEMPSDAELGKLTKAKLEELGREFGIELDKRKTKANMIADLRVTK